MRLWSLHPALLDSKGLVALWREALLAQHVLMGKTKGYKFHPQLDRFKDCPKPLEAIATYLWAVNAEASERGYNFDASKINQPAGKLTLPVATGQLTFELEHLKAKLQKRDPERGMTLNGLRNIIPHPLFVPIAGDREEWERV